MRLPEFYAIHSPGLYKGKEMGIRSQIKQAKETPKQAIAIAIIAVMIASLALLVAMGKKG